jgi:hypothetical protein
VAFSCMPKDVSDSIWSKPKDVKTRTTIFLIGWYESLLGGIHFHDGSSCITSPRAQTTLTLSAIRLIDIECIRANVLVHPNVCADVPHCLYMNPDIEQRRR